MERLTSGSAFRLQANEVCPYPAGLYRVLIDHPLRDLTVAVQITCEDKHKAPLKNPGGRPRKATSKRAQRKPDVPLVGTLVFMNRQELRIMHGEGELTPNFTVLRAVPTISALSPSSRAAFEHRIEVMYRFLNLKTVLDAIEVDRGITQLIAETAEEFGVSEIFVRRQWSNLCKFGFVAESLIPVLHRCGAPGATRFIDGGPNGRRAKAGRKDTEQRIHQLTNGQKVESEQLGITECQSSRILAADNKFPSPKPAMRERVNRILQSAFLTVAVTDEQGNMHCELPPRGHYPNRRQIRRVLTRDLSKLQKLEEKLTKSHVRTQLRGLHSKIWEDVAGPSHRWSIDSTIGDIYLRSSINRAWYVGRPIIYIIVDVWSTAVMGFYVCLHGPSWAAAKVALFNACSNPELILQLAGHTLGRTLFPSPSLPFEVQSDNGEYLSSLHRETAIHLIPMTSYVAPYRGDYKGDVEVMHRIVKDQQFFFAPGAIDARRPEREFKKYDPSTSVLTLQEYTQLLAQQFRVYNLTADRRHRLDAAMIADEVSPNPAGLWKWGHAVGIGFSQHHSRDQLIQKLLPQGHGHIGKSNLKFGGLEYSSSHEATREWTTYARNFGGRDIPVNHYPGAVSSIWSPISTTSELIPFSLIDQSRCEAATTWEEWSDVRILEVLKRPEIEHQRNQIEVDSLQIRQQIVRNAKQLTAQAEQENRTPRPTITEARQMENDRVLRIPTPEEPANSTDQFFNRERMAEYEKNMAALLEAR